jgi:hypothetical protein
VARRLRSAATHPGCLTIPHRPRQEGAEATLTKELVARIAQRVRRLGLAHDVNGGSPFAQLAAQVGEVRVAGDQAEGVGPAVKQGLLGVQRQGNVGRVLPRGVLVLQAGREGQAHQRFLPLVGQGGVVAVTTAKHHPAELGHHTQRVLQDIGFCVVAVHEHGNAVFCTGWVGTHLTGDNSESQIIGRVTAPSSRFCPHEDGGCTGPAGPSCHLTCLPWSESWSQ